MARPRKLTDEQRIENKKKSNDLEINKERRRQNSLIYYYKKKIKLCEEKEKQDKISNNIII